MDVVFWGATGQAKVLKEYTDGLGMKLLALFDNNPEIASPFVGVPIYYGESGLCNWIAQAPESAAIGFFAAIGGHRGKERFEIQAYASSLGLRPLVAQHPTAFVAATAEIGQGSQILANSAVSVDAIVGEACIINTSASVDHDCTLGDGVHIGPGVTLAGCVDVGDYATVYSGAVVLPRIKIGVGAIVGAGAVVTRDVPEHVVVVGNPARVTRRE